MGKRLLVVAILVIAGCDKSAPIKDAIRGAVPDPGSTQFKNFVIDSEGAMACIEWNTKNRMGGYTDWKVSRFEKLGDRWSLVQEFEFDYNCTELGFMSLQVRGLAESRAKKEVAKYIPDSENMSNSQLETQLLLHCDGAGWNYVNSSGNKAQVEALGGNRVASATFLGTVEKNAADMKSAFGKLTSKECVD